MAEDTPDLRALPKREAYAQLLASADAILEGIDDEVCEMATLACLVHQGFGHLWTGFYRTVRPSLIERTSSGSAREAAPGAPRLLRVGPYQGSLGCLEIAFGRGVCGTAAAERRTVIVPDVEAFPGHIACDARARSEIVVPVLGADGSLRAVLDVDSARLGTFDEEDAEGLQRLVARFARR